MAAKFRFRAVSILLVLVIAFIMPAAVQSEANAAETAVTVTIAEVSRSYYDCEDVLELINEYRTANKTSKVEMDEKLMEKAFLRASELSVSASSQRPDGSNNIDGLAELIGYDVWSNSSLVEDWSSYLDGSSILYSSSYKSVGVGVVEICGYKYVCALFSTKAVSSKVDESTYQQYGVVVDQSISALPSTLSNIRMGFTDNMQIYCGASINAYVYVTNKKYTSVGAYLTADNMNVTIEKPDCFTYTYNQIKAVTPGTSRITISSKENSSITATASLKAVSMSFDSCSIASIPDQYYTGSAICPNISIKNSSGKSLVLGTDYTVEYKNNIKVGTASAVITGRNAYSGQVKTVNFKIVLNTSQVFSITASVSPASIIIGSSATINVKPSGAITPVTYLYQYAPSGSSSWTKIASSSNTSCSFKPSEAKTYNIKVTATDNAGRTASQTVSLKVESKLTGSVSMNKETYSIGENVVITASQQGGTGVTYAFYAKFSSASSWTTLQDFSSVAHYNYVPQNPGEYTVCVKFKSSNGQETKVYKTFNVTGTALANNSSISSGTVYLGKAVTLRGAAAGGSGSYQYSYLYKLQSSSAWSTIQKFGTKATASFTPGAVGSYDLCVKVKDSTENIVKKYFTLTCSLAFNNTSKISASKINLGDSVVITGSSSSKNTCTYAVWYHTKGTSGWSKVQDYSSNSKISITPSKSGTFEACIRVKDSTGAVSPKYFEFSVNSKLVNKSTLSSLSIETGGSVTVKCAATGGAGSYTYLIQYRKSGVTSWTVKQNYTSNTSATIQLSSAGKYEFNIGVKDSIGGIATITKTVTVSTPIVPKLTVSKSSIVCGQTVAFSVTATGGTGGFTYAFYYKDTNASDWIQKQNFSANTKVEAKPSKAGSYEVCVKVKDSSGTVKKTYGSFKVTPAVTVKASLSSATIIKGQSTTVTAAASNGSGGYQYAIYLKKSDASKWTEKQAFGTNAKLSLKPAYSGAYQVCVKAKDSIGGIAKIYLNITVKPSIENTSSLSAASIKLKSSVTVNTTAKNGSGGYTFAVLYKKASSEKWTTVQDFKSSSSVKVTPLAATNYDICVKAKDSIGTVSKKYFTLKVTA